VQHTTDVLEATRAFTQIETLEVLYRPWHLKGQSVRPVQQMVSHTAFLTFARRLAAKGRKPGEVPLAEDGGALPDDEGALAFGADAEDADADAEGGRTSVSPLRDADPPSTDRPVMGHTS
jgi:hypothetical protein